jgi:hypothetical protein
LLGLASNHNAPDIPFPRSGITNSFQSFQKKKKIKVERILPNLFYKASIILTPKPDEEALQEKLISLMKIRAKILNKILAN